MLAITLVLFFIFHFLYIKFIFSFINSSYDCESSKTDEKIFISKILSLFIFILPKNSSCIQLNKFYILAKVLFIFNNFYILLCYFINYEKITKMNFKYNKFRFKCICNF